MRDPLRRLKFLPWRSLFQVAVLTNLIVAAIEFILVLGYIQSPIFSRAISLLYAPPLDILMTIAVAIGVGAMAVYILERWYQKVIINTATLWALVPCLALILFLKSLLPIPPLLVNLDQTQLMCMIVGIFWKGRPHWQ